MENPSNRTPGKIIAGVVGIGLATSIEKEGSVGKGAKAFMPLDEVGNTVKTIKTKAGNTVIDGEARGIAHTQLRQDATGNYPQRTTFDAKGRKRSDTHFTTHNEPKKTDPHKHTYYKNGKRAKQAGE